MGGITPEQAGEIIPESVGDLSPEWWAQSLRNHHKEPDAAARAYLRVIAREPDVVRRALDPLPQP
jgi:hypothetical protein